MYKEPIMDNNSIKEQNNMWNIKKKNFSKYRIEIWNAHYIGVT